ncbi:deoxyribonuclease IV [Patescibacteria group bacterium]|nr:deoxyribonuclease IV [Patescibacteria group bacterium]
MKKPLLGAHVSTAGGLFKAVENATAIGAESIQIFGASPRQWKARLPVKENIEIYKDAVRQSKVGSVYLHAAYLVNLASADKEIHKKSVENLSTHFKIANLIGAKGLVFHIGSAKGVDISVAKKNIVAGMKKVLKNVSGESFLIMENSSGGGGKIGVEIDEVGELLKSVGSNRVKICLDTAHAFEAGTLEVSQASIKKYFDKWESRIGLDNLVVIHANDSKTAYGSQSDRHENIGEGHIGMSGFKNLAKEKRLWNKDWILEVPGFDGMGPDKKNLDILKSLF